MIDIDKYRLTIFPAMGGNPHSDRNVEFHFKTIEELNAAADACALLLIFIQDELRLMDDYSNMFVRDIFIDGEWEELEDD